MKSNEKNAKPAPQKNKELGAGLVADLKKQLTPTKSTKSKPTPSNLKIVMVNSGNKVVTTDKTSVTKSTTTKSATKKATEPKSTLVPTKKVAPVKPDLKKVSAANTKAAPKAKPTASKTAIPKATAAAPNTKTPAKAESKVTAKSTTSKAATKTSTNAPTKKAATTATKTASTNKAVISKPKKSTVVSDGEFFSLKTERVGNFEIKKSKDGRFVFNLYASNHSIVATSQVYSSSAAAMNGIKSVILNASTSPIEDQTLKKYETLNYPKWEIYLDKGDQYRFRLSASNGSCICHSQGYTNKANCKNGIDSIIKFASDAEITKAYLEKK